MPTVKKRVPVKEGLWTSPSVTESPRLLGSRCLHCGEVFFPKRIMGRCNQCGQRSLEHIPLSLKGKISSFTVTMREPAGGYYKGPVPYAYGCVDLPEGVRILTLFAGCDFDHLRVGMEVEQIIDRLWEDEEGNELITYKFRPVREESCSEEVRQ